MVSDCGNTGIQKQPRVQPEAEKEKQRIKKRNRQRSIIWAIGCGFFWVALYAALDFLTPVDFVQYPWIYVVPPIVGFFCTYDGEHNSYFFAFGVEGALITVCTICHFLFISRMNPAM